MNMIKLFGKPIKGNFSNQRNSALGDKSLFVLSSPFKKSILKNFETSFYIYFYLMK